jgi:predicted SnoaL-like aldol condensation-catalyzing enzyme
MILPKKEQIDLKQEEEITQKMPQEKLKKQNLYVVQEYIQHKIKSPEGMNKTIKCQTEGISIIILTIVIVQFNHCK